MIAYITAPNKEETWTVLGPEFSKDTGLKAIVIRDSFGLKSIGAAFICHMAYCMRHLGNESNEANPNLWMKV